MTTEEILKEHQLQLAQSRPQNARMTGDEWRAWCQRMIDEHNAVDWQRKTHTGDGEPCVFLPFCGEFGHRWMYHVRRVHFSTATEKVVCCHRGEESMYPTATSFFYEWQHPVDDVDRQGTDRCLREWPAIRGRFPGKTPIQGGGLTYEQEWRCVEPERRIPFAPKPRGLTVDVCIGTRARGFIPEKNWPHCQAVADAVRGLGLTFAVIGHRSNSYPLAGMEYMSGDFGDIDAAIELVRNCRFFFAQDSGSCHLASTVGVDMAVLDVPDHILGRRPGVNVRTFFDRMRVVNQDHRMTRIDRALWDDVDAVVQGVVEQVKVSCAISSSSPATPAPASTTPTAATPALTSPTSSAASGSPTRGKRRRRSASTSSTAATSRSPTPAVSG